MTQNTFRRSRVALVGGLPLIALSSAVMAHHPMGSTVPMGAASGFLSGLGHPVIGIDHFAFLLGLGALTALQRGAALLMPLAFVLAGLLGTVAASAGFLPLHTSVGIGLSLIGLGAALWLGYHGNTHWAIGGVALAGGLHGLAYGTAVLGAETTALWAYLLGLGLVQLTLVTSVRWLTRRALSFARAQATLLVQRSGAALGLGGLAMTLGAAWL